MDVDKSTIVYAVGEESSNLRSNSSKFMVIRMNIKGEGRW
jgi:hypothetical protein